ncbi:MAG: RHS repeat-associated core domain-containing protein, partial [Candidatus Nealsonbacteria bacterium]|nr:RHS repeat-associated core domain-containing protein [Candidatus Nealsonbacteria bacterium]
VPGGPVPSAAIQGDGTFTTWFAYDALNREICAIDALGGELDPLGSGPDPSVNQPTYYSPGTEHSNGSHAVMDDVTRYEWDHRNRLTAVREYADAATEPMAELLWSVEYTYDSLDRQIRKTVDGDGDGTIDDWSYSVHVGDELHLAITDPDGLANGTSPTFARRHLYGPATDQILAVDDGVEALWALSDHEGTVRDVIDSTSELADHRQYDSFGNMQQTFDPNEPNDPNEPLARFPFTYTGRLLDPHTLLYNYRARWYDAAVGRFVNEDPAGLSADANLYRYAANSPMIFVDPSGLGYTGFSPDLGTTADRYIIPAFNSLTSGWATSNNPRDIVHTTFDNTTGAFSAQVTPYVAGGSVNVSDFKGGMWVQPESGIRNGYRFNVGQWGDNDWVNFAGDGGTPARALRSALERTFAAKGSELYDLQANHDRKLYNMIDDLRESVASPYETMRNGRIGIFMDGTGCFFNNESNVTKMYDAFNGTKFYYGGLGNETEYGGTAIGTNRRMQSMSLPWMAMASWSAAGRPSVGADSPVVRTRDVITARDFAQIASNPNADWRPSGYGFQGSPIANLNVAYAVNQGAKSGGLDWEPLGDQPAQAHMPRDLSWVDRSVFQLYGNIPQTVPEMLQGRRPNPSGKGWRP